MSIRWKSIPIYGGYIVGLSPLVWLTTYGVYTLLPPGGGMTPQFHNIVYVLLFLLLACASIGVPILGFIGWDERTGTLRIPLPGRTDEKEALEHRLRECQEVRAEVYEALSRTHSPESAFAVTLRARLTELAGAEETIKAEIDGEDLVALDKKATKIVRKALKT